MKALFKTLAASTIASLFATHAAAQIIETSTREDLTTDSRNGRLSDLGETGVLFAQISTYNDSEPASARIRVKPNNGAVRVRVQRSDYADVTPEDIDIISFVGDPSALGLTGETGSFESTINSREQRFAVDFANSYDNPVMFVQVIHGGDPITAQPIFVEGDGALVSVAEASDYDGAQSETVKVNWAVFEAGRYTLTDGRSVLVGAVDSSTYDYDIANGTVVSPRAAIDGDIATPFAADAAIFAQAQRTVGNAWQSVRLSRSNVTSSGWFAMPSEYLDSLTLRHTRDTGTESADVPEVTVGPIGYLIIGEQSDVVLLESPELVFQTDIDTEVEAVEAVDSSIYDVADGSDTRQVTLTRSVYVAMGGDRDSENTTDLKVSTTRDSLGVVRVRMIELADTAGAFVEYTDGDTTVTGSLDTGAELRQVEFSDGTSAFYQGTSDYRLTVDNGVVRWAEGNVGRNERFRVMENDDGTISLHTYFGYHLSVAADGTLTADATELDDSASFLVVDLGELAMSAEPSLRLQEADVDDDGDEELILFADQDDGTGYLMLDPLGIADVLYKAGYEPDDDFIDLLSSTQQDDLLTEFSGVTFMGDFGQLEAVDSIDDITGDMIKSAIDTLDMLNQTRTYTAVDYEYVLEGSYASESTSSGMFGATVSIGSYEIMTDDDEFGKGYRREISLVTLEGTIGGFLTGTVQVGTVYSACDVDKNGFAYGGGVDVVSVTVMVGDADGSYASVSTGVGTGYYFAGSWGQNDQYGFTTDLPIVPVSVSIYVSGDDAEAVADEIADWTIESYGDVEDFAESAWASASDWTEGAAGTVSAAVQNAYNDTRVAVTKAGNKAITVAEEAGESVFEWVDDAGADLANAMNDIGNALANGISDIGSAIEDFFGDWF